jgi:DtxR family Mn-dependent transcriptional regulator
MTPDYATSPQKKLTPSLEDYLEAVFDLGPPARVSSIARHLDVAKASVTQAVQRLVEKGLVECARYGRVNLTEKGLRLAQKVRRRHNILVTFLEEVLGVSAATARHDACVLEHGLSDETTKRLAAHILNVAEGGKTRRKTRRAALKS